MTDTREQGDFDQLIAPFPRDLIQWRAKSLTRNHDKALALAYVESRPMMARLDEVFGPGGWADDYKEFPSGKLACGIGILVKGEWVWKWDGSGTDEDKGDKGIFTDAFKRACVKWNVGGARNLYDLPKVWIPCETYIGEDGKERFSHFTDDPWDYVEKAPNKSGGSGGQSPGRESGNGPAAETGELDMDTPLGFGRKHKDTPKRDVPRDYLEYMVRDVKADKWNQLARRILDAREMDQSGGQQEEDASQAGDRAAGKVLVPELKLFEQHLKPTVWLALLDERYGVDASSDLDNEQQEDLLAYLQAEGKAHGPYVKDAETGKEVIKALYPNKSYRTLFPDEMTALEPILEAHWKISQARDSIEGARIIITGFESRERQSIYAATLLQLRGIIEDINGQVEPGERGRGPEDDIPF